MKRVVVAGIGVLSPIGNDKEEYWEGLRSGKSGIETITLFDTRNYKFKRGGEIKDFNPTKYFTRKGLRRLDRASQMVLIATQEAIDDAQINFNQMEKNNCGVVLGTTLGGMVSGEKYYRHLKKRQDRVYASLLLDFPMYSATDHISIRYKCSGSILTISTACSASNQAIGCAFDLIRKGEDTIIITGGFDPLSELTFAGFGILRIMSLDKIRPFDKNRTGLILGEGVGILILEELEHALNRKAKIYAEIIGYGATTDAYHMTAPHPQGEGAANAMQKALDDANIKPDDVDYINAHGTGTLFNDLSETMAIKKIMGEGAYKIPISSTKSMIGHTLGAAGALEAIATILAMQKGIIPPTINYETPDPKCDLNYVPNYSIQKNIRIALSNSFGFGGNNATIVFKKWEGETDDSTSK
ncbi:MAG: beta-ketoacyl-[acyl-carrier-protein] synthase family protein [bacterium]